MKHQIVRIKTGSQNQCTRLMKRIPGWDDEILTFQLSLVHEVF
jgi:hypothetical protein